MRPFILFALLIAPLTGCVDLEPEETTSGSQTSQATSTSTTNTPGATTGASTKGGWRTLEHSNAGSSGVGKDPIRRLINTQPEWESFWRDYASNSQPTPPAPAVDFPQQFVLVVSQGKKMSSGYNVTIEEARWSTPGADAAVVRFVETSPGPTCVTAAVETHPIHMIAMWREGRADPDATFERDTATKTC